MRRVLKTSLTLSVLISGVFSAAAFAQSDVSQEALPKANAGLAEDISTDGGSIDVLSQQDLYEAYLKEKETLTAAPEQERCITIMSGFPNSGALPRYQFFKLTEDMAIDSTPEFRMALSEFGDGDVADETPILDVVEVIANPVLRQAAPEIVVSNMAHLIGFAQDCDAYVTGQINSLRAADNRLSQDDIVIAEDALYLRQVLSESLSRLGGETDYIHGEAIQTYAKSLIVTRDAIEYAGFDDDIEDLEALYLTDLDGRLARSNDLINSEINRETLGDAVALSRDLSNTSIQQEKARSLNTLLRILGGGY